MSATVTFAVTSFLRIENSPVHSVPSYVSVSATVALTVYSPAAVGTAVEYAVSAAVLSLYSYVISPSDIVVTCGSGVSPTWMFATVNVAVASFLLTMKVFSQVTVMYSSLSGIVTITLYSPAEVNSVTSSPAAFS